CLQLTQWPAACKDSKRRLVNHADDVFLFHRDKLDTDQIVMRQVHDAVAGEGAKRHEQKCDRNSNGGRFHRRKITTFRKHPTVRAALAFNVQHPISNSDNPNSSTTSSANSTQP